MSDPRLFPEKVVGTFPVRGGGEWDLTESHFEELRATFPRLDVLAELRLARQWLRSNPRRQKKDLPRFLNNWLLTAERERRRGGSYDPSQDGLPPVEYKRGRQW